VSRSLAPLLSALLLAGGCSKAKVVVVEEPTADGSTLDAPPAVPSSEQDAVREAVRHYAAALGARDAEAAVEWVVSDTFTLYEDLRRAALLAKREQLEGRDLMSVILILQIRAELDREQLEQLDGRGLFERAVRAGLVGDDIDAITLDEVWIDEAGERAEIRIEGEPVVWLRKLEDDHWRVDIPTMISLLGPALEAMARERVVADGMAWTALTIIELGSDDVIDTAIIDGPLDAESNE
jgi:outer membrane murein-binding lipoprotein Lpp